MRVCVRGRMLGFTRRTDVMVGVDVRMGRTCEALTEQRLGRGLWWALVVVVQCGKEERAAWEKWQGNEAEKAG